MVAYWTRYLPDSRTPRITGAWRFKHQTASRTGATYDGWAALPLRCDGSNTLLGDGCCSLKGDRGGPYRRATRSPGAGATVRRSGLSARACLDGAIERDLASGHPTRSTKGGRNPASKRGVFPVHDASEYDR